MPKISNNIFELRCTVKVGLVKYAQTGHKYKPPIDYLSVCLMNRKRHT